MVTNWYLLLFTNILIFNNCYASSIDEVAIKLNSDGNVKWVLDTERTSGDLGNDPDSNCIVVYRFDSDGKTEESCTNEKSNTITSKKWIALQEDKRKNSIMIGEDQYAVISSNGCFMRLSSVSGSKTEGDHDKIFKKVPSPEECNN